MGKYLRKNRATVDVVDIEDAKTKGLGTPVSGVCTRARTSALHTSSNSEPGFSATSSSFTSSTCYLQLRSRRLHRHPNCSSVTKDKSVRVLRELEGGGHERIVKHKGIRCNDEGCDDEPILHGNFFEFEGLHERNAMEIAPSSLPNRSSKTAALQTSSCSTARNRTDMRTNTSLQKEMEEFFSSAERRQQFLFMEKYNFDVASELPLPGRYEWVEVLP